MSARTIAEIAVLKAANAVLGTTNNRDEPSLENVFETLNTGLCCSRVGKGSAAATIHTAPSAEVDEVRRPLFESAPYRNEYEEMSQKLSILVRFA